MKKTALIAIFLSFFCLVNLAWGETDLKEIKRRAESGNAGAQFDLGYMYGRGEVVPQNYVEAMKWYRKAADQGHAVAQYNLSLMYHKGQGVPQNYTEAIKWYRKAADQGLARAQFNLGKLYIEGEGVPQNYTEAMKWYRKAADQGMARAQYNLGFHYELGLGVPQNYAEAIKWYRKAADQGYFKAQFNLGFMYAQGEGTPKNLINAYVWFSLASANGNEKGKKALELVSSEMTPQQIAQAQKEAAKIQVSKDHPFYKDIKEAYKDSKLTYNSKVERILYRKMPAPEYISERRGLVSELPKPKNAEEEKIILQTIEALYRQFFKKVKTGGQYCSVEKIKEHFGQTPKERIGVSSGGYYRLFVAYWTLKVKLDESGQSNYQISKRDYENVYFIDSLLRFVELALAGAFFPSPGPNEIPEMQRRQGIQDLLQKFAPTMTVKELYEGANPEKVGLPVLK